MKRCARYTLELTIHAMASNDRVFRLLNLSYRVVNLCIDSLNPLCGSEIMEIGDRLPSLKTLIIRNCRIVSLFFEEEMFSLKISFHF